MNESMNVYIQPIKITLLDGSVHDGTSWETSPLDVAKATKASPFPVTAFVQYTGERFGKEADAASDGIEKEEEDDESRGEPWDLNR